jgi:hypothetical protein
MTQQSAAAGGGGAKPFNNCKFAPQPTRPGLMDSFVTSSRPVAYDSIIVDFSAAGNR